MTFNAPLFLFFFLPVALVAFLLARQSWRAWLLLAASLIFYAWGAPLYFPIIVLLGVLNYWLGQRMAQQPERRWFCLGLVGLVAVFMVAQPQLRAGLMGAWTGYFLYGIALPYHISTHNYYQLPAIPLVALGLAVAAGVVFRNIRTRLWLSAPVICGALLFTILVS